jgi:hypothetical protein
MLELPISELPEKEEKTIAKIQVELQAICHLKLFAG